MENQKYVRTKNAALKVQTWGRMASVQRGYQADRSRAITVQCLVRKRSAKGEFKRRKKEKGDVDALQAKIKAYEVRAVSGTLWFSFLRERETVSSVDCCKESFFFCF